MYKLGETKVVNKYLFLPKTYNGITRWLQYARMEYIYVREEDVCNCCGMEVWKYSWKFVKFID